MDEIDDHLHPSLQARVIKALQHTFPRVQFIISTHAPMVMTSVEDIENNVVYRLDYQEGNYLAEVVSTYGLDASSIIQFYLHQADKDIDVQRQLDELFKLVDEEKIEEAKAMLTELEAHFSDRLPEITRARTLMSFYEV
jgi:predicted ATP-binding protein involved in virulence